MCGISGIFNYSGSTVAHLKDTLVRVNARLVSRGPDASGYWLASNNQVGFAHRRLSIIDLTDAGAQPMEDHLTGNRLVFNGEIYNYRELRSELQQKGVVFQSDSDTEVLLLLYRVYGAAMLPMLRGMFAFALWDEAKQGVLLARDPFGIKPLYYSDDGRTLRFASQVNALLAGGDIDTRPDPAGHTGFFLWGHVPEPHTLYLGIRALPAGASCWVQKGTYLEVRTFFSLREEVLQAEAASEAFLLQDEQAQLREALQDTVQKHLIADVPVGIFLSAGLDSGAIVGLARDCGAEALRTFTLGFEAYRTTPEDEVPLASLVAKQYGAKQTTAWIARSAFSMDFQHLMEVMDQPSMDGVNSYFVSKAARAQGLKVALSGLGGDELFAGYPSFRELPGLVQGAGLLGRVPLIKGVFRPVLKQLGNQFSPKYAGLLDYGNTYAGAYLLRRSLYMPYELSTFLEPELVWEGLESLDTLKRLDTTIAEIKDPRLRISVLEMEWYMRNQLLRDADWASMAHGLEVRVPFVDVPLMRTVIRLVVAGARIGKQQMAAAPMQQLPKAVLQRRKTGFTIPVREWLLEGYPDQAVSSERGLRSWAKVVYRHFGGEGLIR